MSRAAELVLKRLEQCVRDIPDIPERSDSKELGTGKVSRVEKCRAVERCCFREPCPGTIKDTPEHCPPEVNFTVEISLVEYDVSTEFNPMEVGDVIKFRSPKTDTFVENRAVKIGTSLEDRFTECTDSVEDSFIEIKVRLKERPPKIYIFLEDHRSEINDVFKRTPNAGKPFVEKNPVVFVAFQFDRKDINDPFYSAIRECDRCRITLEASRKTCALMVSLCFSYISGLCLEFYLLRGAGLKFCEEIGKRVFENGFRLRSHNGMTDTVSKMVNLNIIRI